jgi:hypothetical protein
MRLRLTLGHEYQQPMRLFSHALCFVISSERLACGKLRGERTRQAFASPVGTAEISPPRQVVGRINDTTQSRRDGRD